MIEYPKSLYLRGWDDLSATVIVSNRDEEAEARAQGYRHLAEPVAEVAVTPADSVSAAVEAPRRRGRPPRETAE